MLKAYKYRIYPNKEQKVQIAKTFGCCRFVYNKTLVYRKDAYEKENRSVSKTDCNHYCNRELKKENEWLKEVDKFNLIQQTSQMESNIKAENALEWTGCLNNIRVYAGKIVERELIYT